MAAFVVRQRYNLWANVFESINSKKKQFAPTSTQNYITTSSRIILKFPISIYFRTVFHEVSGKRINSYALIILSNDGGLKRGPEN